MGCPSAGHPTDIFMDYSVLINNKSGKCSRVGIIGATKGYGYTLLAQIPTVKHMSLRCICSRHPEECLEVLQETGFDVSRIAVCTTEDEIRAAGEEAIIVTPDYRLVMETGITAMVECTGNTAVSSDAAILALKKGINVYMVSKETDSVCGPILNQIAEENGAVYTLVNGDQPRNLLDLISWAQLLGLEIVWRPASSSIGMASMSRSLCRRCSAAGTIKDLRPWISETHSWGNTGKSSPLTSVR